jgi:predicted RNase H-like nuclease (RuvC/YqgF family)
MKKLLFICMCAMSLVACKQDKAKGPDPAMAQQRDSLNQIIAQKENELNDMMGTMNEIEEGFREINEAQNRVNLAKRGEGENRTQRIRENIQFIQSTMRQNRELISKLRQQLRESSIKSDQFTRTIENLTKQLEEKDRQLQQLRAELDAKDIHITELDEKIAGLNTDVNNLTAESSEKSNKISNQDKQLHTAWFVFGTKSELKEQNILVDGKVLQSNFNKDYFTKIDIRVDKEIKLYSRSAKVLTTHPSSSYTLQRDANKQYVLRITNPQTFWGTSKYLVVLVK